LFTGESSFCSQANHHFVHNHFAQQQPIILFTGKSSFCSPVNHHFVHQ